MARQAREAQRAATLELLAQIVAAEAILPIQKKEARSQILLNAGWVEVVRMNNLQWFVRATPLGLAEYARFANQRRRQQEAGIWGTAIIEKV